MTGIEVVVYDERWPVWFENCPQRYEAALSEVSYLSIEHVGSTSVPGLAAKPIIDIDIVVERDDVAAAIGALEAIGYESLGEMGITDRWAVRAPADSIRDQHLRRRGRIDRAAESPRRARHAADRRSSP